MGHTRVLCGGGVRAAVDVVVPDGRLFEGW